MQSLCEAKALTLSESVKERRKENETEDEWGR